MSVDATVYSTLRKKTRSHGGRIRVISVRSTHVHIDLRPTSSRLTVAAEMLITQDKAIKDDLLAVQMEFG